ncbi:MAG: hypothetical protein K0Q72_3979, partial [Armatimonadetes bacterium]|nr:hypothetical protein [Armatimonadota bacterium]
VVDARPARIQGLPEEFQDLSHIVGLPVGYAPALIDPLEWGPQHVDLAVQRQMRLCFARSTLYDDEATLRLCCRVMEAGDELVFWADPGLTSCLKGLWVLAWMQEHAPDRKVSLVVDPDPVYLVVDRTIEEFHRLFSSRLPVADLRARLRAVRDHLASDSDEITVDATGLPDHVGAWVSLGSHLENFLPDRRGLDLFDDRLLEHLTDDWQRAGWPIGNSMLFTPDYVRLPNSELWDRLVELSDQSGLLSRLDQAPGAHLCELRIEGRGSMSNARVRISRLGQALRSGRSDAFKHRNIYRWVGGRLITNERILRRPGSYRQKNYRGSIDPESIPFAELPTVEESVSEPR